MYLIFTNLTLSKLLIYISQLLVHSFTIFCKCNFISHN